MDALAATAAAIALGIPAGAVSEGFSDFTGAGRRFEYKGSLGGACVYDDYAHHPHELKNLLDMVSSLGYRRILLAFQPHTYTRTKALFDDFVAQLRRADRVFLAEIYAAREKNTIASPPRIWQNRSRTPSTARRSRIWSAGSAGSPVRETSF
jgi:UDP-N-acetylmuramate--alanine ligase